MSEIRQVNRVTHQMQIAGGLWNVPEEIREKFKEEFGSRREQLTNIIIEESNLTSADIVKEEFAGTPLGSGAEAAFQELQMWLAAQDHLFAYLLRQLGFRTS